MTDDKKNLTAAVINQIDWTDLDNAFLKEHPGCVVHGYDTVGEQVIGFVDD